MQYDAKNPTDYLDSLAADWRKEKLINVRNLIKEHGPELTEGIEYKMLSFGFNENNIFHLNAQSAYVSLYVGSIDKVRKAKELLKEFDTGKGCIRIKKSVNIEKTGLREFIKRVIDISRKGGNTDC